MRNLAIMVRSFIKEYLKAVEDNEDLTAARVITSGRSKEFDYWGG